MISALHILNGVFIFGVTVYLVRESTKFAGLGNVLAAGALKT